MKSDSYGIKNKKVKNNKKHKSTRCKKKRCCDLKVIRYGNTPMVISILSPVFLLIIFAPVASYPM